MKQLLKLWCSVVCTSILLAGCSVGSSEPFPSKAIIISHYALEIPEDFHLQALEQYADPRVAGKLVALYKDTALTDQPYQDNLVVSQDILPPDMSLQDYALAGFEAIAHTRHNARILSTSTRSGSCQALTHTLLTQSFRIDRLVPHTNDVQILYFVQGYMLENKSLLVISLSTSNQQNVSKFEGLLDSISCT